VNDLDPVHVGQIQVPSNIANRAISYVACDCAYFQSWLPVLNLDPGKSLIARCICIYVVNQEEIDIVTELIFKINHCLRQKLIFVSFFTQPVLEDWLKSLPELSARTLRINYIRASRYKIAKTIQKKIFSLSACSNPRYFVLDADHVCLGDLGCALTQEGVALDSPLIIGWNSQFYNDYKYPEFLKSGDCKAFCKDSDNFDVSFKHAKPYITVKAGFMGISCASFEGELFVDLVSEFAYGGPGSLEMRMFHFYYCDQLAIHMSLEEVFKDCSIDKFSKIFSFVDLSSSRICNLFDHRNSAIYMPKGKMSSPANILRIAASEAL